MCRAAVFVGFTLEAIEFVAPDDAATFAGVETLVDQSLLRHEVDSGRFSMLETIREFAVEEARSRGLLAEAQRRHATRRSRTRRRAGCTEPATHVGSSSTTSSTNLRAALQWTLETDPPQPELAARLAVALGQHWYTHGRAIEGTAWLRRVHAVAGIPPGLRAGVAQRLGVLLDQQADKPGAAEVLEEALDLFRQVGDRAGEGRALNSLASAVRSVASNARARDLYDQALRVRVEIHDEAGISVTTFNLGLLAMDDGDYEGARVLFERSHDIDASLGDEWGAMIGSLGTRNRGSGRRAG